MNKENTQLQPLVKFNQEEVMLPEGNTVNRNDITAPLLNSYINNKYYEVCNDFNDYNRRSELVKGLYMDKVNTILYHYLTNIELIMKNDKYDVTESIRNTFSYISNFPVCRLQYYTINKNIDIDTLVKDCCSIAVSMLFSYAYQEIYDGTAESITTYNNFCEDYTTKAFGMLINTITEIITLSIDIANNENVIEFNERYEKSMI